MAGRRSWVTGRRRGSPGRRDRSRCGRCDGAAPPRREAELDEVVRTIEAHGGKAFAYPCNLNDADATDATIARILDEHAGVDILVNTRAARSGGHSTSPTTGHTTSTDMRLNDYFAAVRLMLAVLPGMRERRYGQVINVLSAATCSADPATARTWRRRPRSTRCAPASGRNAQ
ncbi:SDR family NAD(P)-dependent oxidoreductase [Rhodococcus hoagii]|nr:SDR family NAD(P)-dependent oxidoreductase [Prescottella equi]